MRAGDTVRHTPSGEKWIVAAMSDDEQELSPAGWPESIAKTSDCTIIKSASDDKHDAMVMECRKLPAADIRRRWTPTPNEPSP